MIAYWFIGPKRDGSVIEGTFGRVRWAQPDEPAKWKTAFDAKPTPGDLKSQAVWKELREVKLDDNHPLKGLCQSYRQTQNGAVIGIAIGPPSLDMHTEEAKRDLASVKAELIKRAGSRVTKGSTASMSRYYEELSAPKDEMVVNVSWAVENHRCVAYWSCAPKGTKVQMPYGAALSMIED